MTQAELLERSRTLSQSVLSAKSTVWYYYQQGRVDGARIHLGELGEIALPNFRVFCMLARRGLRDQELSKIGEVGRKLLHKPFDYLSAEIVPIWGKAAPGKAIALLAEEFSRSLFVSAPTPCQVPEHFAKYQDKALSSVVENHLFGVLKVSLEQNLGAAQFRIVEDETTQLALAA
jgi:hypothetical protein